MKKVRQILQPFGFPRFLIPNAALAKHPERDKQHHLTRIK